MGICVIRQSETFKSEVYDDELDISGAESASTLEQDLNYIRSVVRALHGGTANWYTFEPDHTIPEIVAAITAMGGGIGTVDLALEELNNATITSVTSGEILKFDGTAWINNTLAEAGIAEAGHSHTLDSLSNVTVSGKSTGEVLQWDGSAWINRTLSEAGIAAASHTHAAGDITSGTFSNSRISSSSVRQHITKSYIDGLNVDADTLDGINSTSFIRKDATATFGTWSLAGNQTITIPAGGYVASNAGYVVEYEIYHNNAWRDYMKFEDSLFLIISDGSNMRMRNLGSNAFSVAYTKFW